MLTIACSPCPNDIFLFRSFLKTMSPEYSVHIADIAELNRSALHKQYSLIKISAALFPQVAKHYRLMRTGTIIGHNVGPLLLKLTEKTSPIRMIATPGETTTAHILCKIFYPQAILVPMKYYEVIPAILEQTVCGGVVIHEERFSFPFSLSIVQDLGAKWHESTHKPLPLGCLVVANHVSLQDQAILEQDIQRSLQCALNDMHGSIDLAAKYSRQPESKIIQQFIKTYVNDETFSLSSTGLAALQELWQYS